MCDYPRGTSVKLYRDMLSQAHCIVGGATGSGKSVLINGLINELLLSTPAEKAMVLIDLKRVELARYRNLPHTIAFCTEREDAIYALSRVIATMESRYKEMEKARAVQYQGGHIYVIIDEFADLIDGGGVADRIKRIGRLGRAANIHLIVATQSPSRKVIPADITLNFTAKLALRCDAAIESRQILNVKGAEMLPNHGVALYRTPQYREPVAVTISLTDMAEVDRLIAHWKAQFKPRLFRAHKTA